MSTQDKIQKLTETLLKLSSNVTLSDAIDSDSDKNAGIAASPKAVSTLASVILEAAKNASEGSEVENEIYEPLLGEVKHEIGSWWFSVDGNIPAGGLPHLGHLVSRSTYGTGWTWIETNKTVVTDEEWLAYAESHNGTCPYYSYGDGSTTFRTPSYDQSFLKVLASISGAGSVEEAGLPNITGSWAGVYNSQGLSGAVSGEFSKNSPDPKAQYVADSEYNGLFDINASRSNPIYGASDTVTPQNYGIIVGIYLVGAVSAPIGETDAAGLLNGLSALETQVAGCVRSVNGVNADAAGDVELFEKYVQNYNVCYRFPNGLQFEFGHGISGSFVSFIKSFKENPRVMTTHNSSTDETYNISTFAKNLSTTRFTPILYSNGTLNTAAYVHYIVIGHWK